MTQLIRRFAGTFQLMFVVLIVGGAMMFAFVLDSDRPVSYPAPARPSLSVSVITPDETVYRHVVNLNGVVATRSELALLEAQATAEKEIWKKQVPDRAILALSRTVIRPPFDARVLETRLDVGQVVNTAAMVGSIFSVDSLEIAAPESRHALESMK